MVKSLYLHNRVETENFKFRAHFFFSISSICYRLATIYFDEHNYESAIKDLKEASTIDDRNLKVIILLN
jgi:hypothetical protein